MNKAIDVLLIEDNEDDVFFTIEAFKENKLFVNLEVINDGENALKYIKAEGEFNDRLLPDLILLDLNLPKIDGRVILEEIRNHPDMLTIPVIILTTSGADEDIIRSYELHANSYIQKPVDFDSFRLVIESLENFWFTVVKLPENKEDFQFE